MTVFSVRVVLPRYTPREVARLHGLGMAVFGYPRCVEHTTEVTIELYARDATGARSRVIRALEPEIRIQRRDLDPVPTSATRPGR